MSKFLLSAAVLLVSISAQAQVHIEASIKPVFSESNPYFSSYGGGFSTDGPGLNPEKTTGFDLRTIFGYSYKGILGGLALNVAQTSKTRSAVEGGHEALSQKVSTTEYGLALGYVGTNWRFIFSYLLSGDRKASDSLKDSTGATLGEQDITNTLGSAYQFTVGYSLNLTNSISFSPTLIYRTATYKSQTKTDKVTPGNSYTDKPFDFKASESDLVPFFGVTAKF